MTTTITTATMIVTPSTHLTLGPPYLRDGPKSWYRPKPNERAATTVRMINTLSLKVIHMICNRFLAFVSGRRLMPKTRFLSTYCSEFARCIGEDGAERTGSL